MGNLTTQHFATRRKVVNILPPKDITSGATASHIDVFSMKNYDKATIIVQFGVVSDSATPGLLTINKCTKVDTTGTTPMAFTYRVETTASGDTLDAVASATSTGIDLDAVLSTTDNVMVVIEIRAEELTSGTATNYDCISMLIAYSGHGSLCSAVAILEGARYQNSNMPSAIVD